MRHTAWHSSDHLDTDGRPLVQGTRTFVAPLKYRLLRAQNQTTVSWTWTVTLTMKTTTGTLPTMIEQKLTSMINSVQPRP
jgi:hypothetical protein